MKRSQSVVLSTDSLAEQERRTRALFDEYKPSGQEVLRLVDLRGALEKLHIPPTRVAEIFEKVDTDRNGVIDYAEFSAYVKAHERELRDAFAAIDTSGDGSVSKEEVQSLLDRMHFGTSEARRDEILRVLDTEYRRMGSNLD